MKTEAGRLLSVEAADIVDGKVTIPDSVKRIGDWAFHGCTSLKAIHMSGN